MKTYCGHPLTVEFEKGLKFPYPGMIETVPSNLREGRILYSKQRERNRSTGILAPFFLSDEQGHLMGNAWQFSKIYREMPNINEKKWSHPAEKHFDEKGNILPRTGDGGIMAWYFRDRSDIR